MTNLINEETVLGDQEKTLQAVRAWLEGNRRAWLERNLKKLLMAEHEGGLVEFIQAELRKKLECGYSCE